MGLRLFLAVVLALSLGYSEARGDSLSNRIDKLIVALISVESNGKLDAIGDNGKALGQLQIWEIYLKDTKRFSKIKYNHKDMFGYYESIETTITYLTHYGKHYEKKTGKVATLEILAKIHNGGPNGYKKSGTNKYWEKVKKVL